VCLTGFSSEAATNGLLVPFNSLGCGEGGVASTGRGGDFTEEGDADEGDV